MKSERVKTEWLRTCKYFSQDGPTLSRKITCDRVVRPNPKDLESANAKVKRSIGHESAKPQKASPRGKYNDYTPQQRACIDWKTPNSNNRIANSSGSSEKQQARCRYFPMPNNRFPALNCHCIAILEVTTFYLTLQYFPKQRSRRTLVYVMASS